MKIKKKYSFTNNRQIWRIIPSNTNLFVIEDRDIETREVFFNCVDGDTGKIIFRNFQFDEKFWMGIEDVHDDIIFFHEFARPDMPQHKGIIAFDIKSQQILWKNHNYVFEFIENDKIYCYQQKFESREFFVLNILNGESLNNQALSSDEMNLLRSSAAGKRYSDLLFPDRFIDGSLVNSGISEILEDFKINHVILGYPEFVVYKELILISTFEPNDKGSLFNFFRAIDIKDGKVIFEVVLNSNSAAIVPGTFFVKNNLIFFLNEKTSMLVFEVN